jgi:hypothetical protein
MHPCEDCKTEVYRKRTELGKHVYCSSACYKAARARDAKSYPKIRGRHAHRVIAEEKLGRPLRSGEIVHHEDEDKRNYAPNNIAVLPSQSEHARHHFAGVPKSAEHRRKISEGVRRARGTA